MTQKGDIFDLGTNEYLEYIENFDDLHDYVIHYTREPMPSLSELKVHMLIEKNSLEDEYRKIGQNEKERLLAVYHRAAQKRSKELENIVTTEGPID